MPTCKDCKNFQSESDLDGHCLASEEKLVDAERDTVDCIANAFEAKKANEDIV